MRARYLGVYTKSERKTKTEKKGNRLSCSEIGRILIEVIKSFNYVRL